MSIPRWRQVRMTEGVQSHFAVADASDASSLWVRLETANDALVEVT